MPKKFLFYSSEKAMNHQRHYDDQTSLLAKIKKKNKKTVCIYKVYLGL